MKDFREEGITFIRFYNFKIKTSRELLIKEKKYRWVWHVIKRLPKLKKVHFCMRCIQLVLVTLE